jgi:sulfonate transport system permease protein
VAWLVPLALLAAWALASERRWLPPQILPAPALVKDTLVDLATSGDLLRHGAISLGRVLGGFALGTLLGLGLGAALGLSRRTEDYLGPLWTAFTQVPALGWIPLLMMVLGIGEALKIALLVLAVVVPVAVNTASGIRNAPASLVEVAQALGFSRAQLLARVVVPAALPALFTGARHGLTQAWLALVTVELLASSEGLGFLIVWGRQLFQLDLVLAAIVLVGGVGLLLDRALQLLEARLLPWRKAWS